MLLLIGFGLMQLALVMNAERLADSVSPGPKGARPGGFPHAVRVFFLPSVALWAVAVAALFILSPSGVHGAGIGFLVIGACALTPLLVRVLRRYFPAR